MQTGAVYIRVSTDEQTEFSPDAQLKSLLDYARKNDILVTQDHVYRDEGISGRRAATRPAFQNMIASAKKKPRPFDVILVHKFDRFARNREDSIVYKSLLRKECGIRVVSITEPLEDDKMSVLIEALLEAMAEYYSLNLAEEVMKGMKEKASRGEKCGRGPLGYDLVNGKLVVNESEAKTVRLIFEKYKTSSQAGIARELNKAGILSKNSKQWCVGSVKCILTNPAFKGCTRYNYHNRDKRIKSENEVIYIEKTHEPIIDGELFEEAQAKVLWDSFIRVKGAKTFGARHWLQHLLLCSECGGSLSIHVSNKGKTASYTCQRGRTAICASTGSVSTKKIEAAVMNQLRKDIESPGELLIKRDIPDNGGDGLEVLSKQLKKIAEQKKMLRAAYINKIDTLEEYRTNRKALDEREEKIKREIEQGKLKPAPANPARFTLKTFADALELDMTAQEKNDLAGQFIKEIKLDLKTKDFQIIYYA